MLKTVLKRTRYRRQTQKRRDKSALRRYYNNAPVASPAVVMPYTHYYVNVKWKGKEGRFFVSLYLMQIRIVISEGYCERCR